ncbi:hypothetical protein MMC06_005420 [Schaereria dolodes]|nr:hypothetical protein [Schaereria dolodes]
MSSPGFLSGKLKPTTSTITSLSTNTVEKPKTPLWDAAQLKRVLYENTKGKETEAAARANSILKQKVRYSVESAQRDFINAQAKQDQLEDCVIADISVEVRSETVEHLRKQYRDRVLDEMREKEFIQIHSELKHEMRDSALKELKAELHNQALAELKTELHDQVLADLKAALYDQALADVKADIRDTVHHDDLPQAVHITEAEKSIPSIEAEPSADKSDLQYHSVMSTMEADVHDDLPDYEDTIGDIEPAVQGAKRKNPFHDASEDLIRSLRYRTYHNHGTNDNATFDERVKQLHHGFSLSEGRAQMYENHDNEATHTTYAPGSIYDNEVTSGAYGENFLDNRYNVDGRDRGEYDEDSPVSEYDFTGDGHGMSPGGSNAEESLSREGEDYDEEGEEDYDEDEETRLEEARRAACALWSHIQHNQSREGSSKETAIALDDSDDDDNEEEIGGKEGGEQEKGEGEVVADVDANARIAAMYTAAKKFEDEEDEEDAEEYGEDYREDDEVEETLVEEEGQEGQELVEGESGEYQKVSAGEEGLGEAVYDGRAYTE